jgi:hypothetical protein
MQALLLVEALDYGLAPPQRTAFPFSCPELEGQPLILA